MRVVIVALAEPRRSTLTTELEWEGIKVLDASDTSTDLLPLLAEAEAIIAPATRTALTADLIAACDREGVRIISLGDPDTRILGRFGLAAPLRIDATAQEIIVALEEDSPTMVQPLSPLSRHRLIAVWGSHGSPGRSTVAIQLAVELTRTGRYAALVDADTVAPSLALLLGLSDDAPGIAAACRRAELGGLDSTELTRIALSLDTSAGPLAVLGGINRPSRWPELSAARLRAALQAIRPWADDTVIDVAAEFDDEDEATYDLAGPRRHAATVTVLREADVVIGVASADPVGISRFLRDYAELRNLIGETPVTVVVNKVRQGPLGIDARGQIRRTLEQFAGITDVVFLPYDQRAADAALLHARPIADVTPRSPLSAAIRRLGTSLAEEEKAMTTRRKGATAGSWRGSFRGARSPH